jgi:primosomal protein N' (replication factor Y) (superfamily II helicase)
MNVARVIVDIALDRVFDYLVPERLGDVAVGSQVVVPFARSRARGYVIGRADSSEHENLKEIVELVGTRPLLDGRVLELAKWISDYYLATVEQGVRTVLPSAVRGEDAAFKERLFVAPLDLAKDAAAVAKLRKKARKQAVALDTLNARGPMFLHDLCRAADVTSTTIRSLERNHFVAVGAQTAYRDPHAGVERVPTQPLTLMPQQAAAMEVVTRAIDTLQPPVVLLHGVTGSGKTEIYLQAIQHCLERGKGAIVLVPEIALTPQTVDRFRGRFGDVCAVLHSSLGRGERHDEWHRVRDGRAPIVVGARSALFAPVRNLGLIVVDEEHEPTYKQEEAPRYHARDVAVMRGHREPCAVLLGSATPSLESLHNCQRGKYTLVNMPARVDHRRMPAMRIVDMRVEAQREGRVNVLSRELCDAIRDRLARAEQTIIFLNRRGFATSLICPKCGTVAECEQCSVAMTYHKTHGELLCHICGARRPVPSACPNPECRDPAFRYAGMGTQRIEDVIRRIFSRARIERMDSDSMTRKESYRETLGQFRTGKIDILVGTQMIAKGLDFPNVTLVGVVAADLSLHIPDFRAGERTFQLLTQVAGRAGRGDVAGEVIVQTFTPHHPAIQAARRLDFEGFCDQELADRQELSYPPFTHLVCITLRGRSEPRVEFSGTTLMKRLAKLLPADVIAAGPTPAPLARAKGEYRFQILLRGPRTSEMTAPLKAVLKDLTFPEDVAVAVDVDALSLL